MPMMLAMWMDKMNDVTLLYVCAYVLPIIGIAWLAVLYYEKKDRCEKVPEKEPSNETIPRVGECWKFRETNDDDPWPVKDYGNVNILDVKDGWVRYYMNSTFPDERRTISSFVKIYRKVTT